MFARYWHRHTIWPEETGRLKHGIDGINKDCRFDHKNNDIDWYMSPPKVDTTKMRVVMPMEEVSEQVACHQTASYPFHICMHSLHCRLAHSPPPPTPPLPNTLQMCVCLCMCVHFSVCILPTPASSTQSTQTEVARDRLLCSPLSDAVPSKC